MFVNGVVAAALRPPPTGQTWWSHLHLFPLRRRWHAGVNQVDVVVTNYPGRSMPGRLPNFMTLQAVLDLSARPIVRR